MKPGTAKGMYYEKHDTARNALSSNGDDLEQGVLGGYNNKNGQWNLKSNPTGKMTPLQIAARAKRKSRKI